MSVAAHRTFLQRRIPFACWSMKLRRRAGLLQKWGFKFVSSYARYSCNGSVMGTAAQVRSEIDVTPDEIEISRIGN